MPRLSPEQVALEHALSSAALLRPSNTFLGAALALLLPQAALAQDQFMVPADCDWTPLWPAEPLSQVSPYRETFYFNTNHEDCGVVDALLTSEDGVESPMRGGAGGRWMYGALKRTGVGTRFPLKAGVTYTMHFTWVSNSSGEASSTSPAQPYTFTTADTDDAPAALDVDDLTIERFERLPDQNTIIFEGHWPNPSPLRSLQFVFNGLQDENAADSYAYEFPARDAPDLRYEFTDIMFLERGLSCASVSVVEDSVVHVSSGVLSSECIDRGCSSIAAAPSVAWLAGLALVLVGRRRGGGR